MPKRNGVAPMAGRAPIRVLIVDDSAAARAALADVIGAEPDLAVMDTASDPYAAIDKTKAELPDVMVLDIELPRRDGLTFLRRIMAQRPLPVVVCSHHTGEGSAAMLRAIEAGAVEVVESPRSAAWRRCAGTAPGSARRFAQPPRPGSTTSPACGLPARRRPLRRG